MNARRTAALAVAASTLAIVGATAPSTVAHASGDDATIRTGSCSGSADWKIKAKPDDGRIEAELEVDSNVAGQLWTVRLSDNTVLVASGSARTAGASGSFEFRRVIANRAGRDTIVAVATHAGQTCRAQVVLAA